MSDTKIKSSNIAGLAVTHDKLHTTMDLTGKTVTVATPSAATHPATKAYVDGEVAGLIDSAPGTLNTLNELAAAVNDDANFNATIATSIATKLPLAGGTMTGAIDMGANNITTTGKVLFGNVYATEGDLPSGSTYHGMFAHVHATGKGYYSHAGAWVQLANAGASGGGYEDADAAAYLATSQNKTINTAGGNVGIGIAAASATAKLHINGTTTSSGQVKVTGSSASAVAFSVGDAGTGFYNTGSNSIGLSINGANKLHVNNGGFVGIGTTSPSAPLDVVTNTNVYAAEFTQSNTSNGDGVSIVVGSTAAADYALTVRSNAGSTSVLAAKADGKVGIGVFSPTSPLHIEGADFSSGTAYIKQTVATNTPTLFIEQVGQGGNGGDNQGLLIKVDGQNAGAGNIIRAIGTNSNLGADIEALTVQNSGKVGIGTASPSAYLHVFKAGSANAGMVPLIKVQTSVNNSTGDGSAIAFHGDYSSTEWGFGKIGGANSGANYGGALEFHTNAGNGSSPTVAYTKRMVIDHLGNLDLVTNGANLKLYYNAAGLYSANLGWRHLQLGNNGANYLVAGATATGGDLTFVVNNTTDLSTNNGASHNGTVAMHIDSTGKVGIGNPAPTYKLDVGGTTEIQARLKSSGGTGWTQGALVIESSDSTDNPGNRGQGVYMYNVPNQRTWYSGTLYNNGNKFGIGYEQASGLQHIAADNSKAMLVIDGDTGVTMPDKLQPNIYEPVIDYAAVAGTFNASGAGTNAWHAITNVNFNAFGNSIALGGRGHNFLVHWTSGNVSRGYNHTVTGHIPQMGANSYISYQGNSYLTSGMDSSHPWTGLINVSHHTAPTSGHDIRVRVAGNGVSYGPLHLQIWAEATPNAANAKISVWRV